MTRPVVTNTVIEELKNLQKGSVLFVDDFLDFGNPERVKKALYRMEKKGLLIRLAHGIYLYPKTDKALGVLYPSAEEIAIAIAKRDKARIIPTGVQALNRLGLSNQIPLKVVFLTDGAARSIKVGKRTITFKKTSPKNLLAKGEISGQIQKPRTLDKNCLNVGLAQGLTNKF